MQTFNEPQIVALAKKCLDEKGLLTKNELSCDTLRIEPIASDGSTRRFWRCVIEDTSLCIVAAPLATSESERKESRAAHYIGSHLHSKGCSVPELYGWHDESGMLLFEDLGDVRLHDQVIASKGRKLDDQPLLDMYKEVILGLIPLQIQGGTGFDPDWCCDTKQYDRELMLTRESGYFLDAYWGGLLQKDTPKGIEEEFQYIADIAAGAPAHYFLHRDFQSRNIMVAGNRYVFIDFQGGRPGPLGYDLASLLIDPYCGVSYELQDELVDFYLSKITEFTKVNKAEFLIQYNGLALQRNLQILGAFAFLSSVRKKPFFVSFIKPALQVAKRRLQEPQFKDFAVLKHMIETGLQAA